MVKVVLDSIYLKVKELIVLQFTVITLWHLTLNGLPKDV